jgi:hypothetical protein
VVGHLGCFHNLAIVNSAAAINMGVPLEKYASFVNIKSSLLYISAIGYRQAMFGLLILLHLLQSLF